ncbi:MAG: pyrroline-5-carboxylate reductase [Betaproteobacteria bacterium]|nr:pyrroline-5-carboxylate reductase [Betaproteobacteria bacterium]
MKINFIGGGNMARAIICGLTNKGFDPSLISVLELDIEKRLALATEFGVSASDNLTFTEEADVIILAVKPQQLKEVCHGLVSALKSQLVVSIAAGIRSADLAHWLGDYQAIIRVMPNTPSQIQAGASALYALPKVSGYQRDQAEQILAAVGKTLWLEDEKQMDAVTAISGSGPAYVFYFIEALQDAGIKLGLSPDAAKMLATQTFLGASMLAAQSAEDVKTLRAQVTSKGGTTEQGILAFESADTRRIVYDAAKAAAEKSVLLGDLLGQ